MDESNSYIYPTIAICIETMDRLTSREYKFTIPSLNFNMNTSQEEKNELKNQNITNIANESNVSINNIEINNYFMIYVPKELMSVCITKAGISGDVQGTGSNFSEIVFQKVNSSGNISTDITIPPHPETSYSINGIRMIVFKLVSGMISGIRQTYKSTKLKIKTDQGNNGIDIMPYDRYISKGSQWVVTFIDGDPSKPAIISRYR